MGSLDNLPAGYHLVTHSLSLGNPLTRQSTMQVLGDLQPFAVCGVLGFWSFASWRNPTKETKVVGRGGEGNQKAQKSRGRLPASNGEGLNRRRPVGAGGQAASRRWPSRSLCLTNPTCAFVHEFPSPVWFEGTWF